MKKRILALCAAVLSVVLLCAACFMLGRENGKKHVLEDSELWVMEFDDSEVLERGYDLRIWIDLDGNSYEHFAYIG